MPGLFIIGTDTHVGKTYVSAIIARQLRKEGHDIGVYKPVASGCVREGGIMISEDALVLWEAAGRPGDLNRVCPQRFAAHLAPHLAAQAEGRDVDKALLRQGVEYWRERSDGVIVEGVGGLLSPLADGPFYVADLAKEFGYPLVLVARNALGTINHTLLTVEIAKARGLRIAGIVLNQPHADPEDASVASNRAELSARAGVPVLGQSVYKATALDANIDWWTKAEGK